MNTMFSFGTPKSGIVFWVWARIEESPQPGHQRTSWSDTKSLRVRAIWTGCSGAAAAGLEPFVVPLLDALLGCVVGGLLAMAFVGPVLLSVLRGGVRPPR